jgi:hypothetical protein
MVDRNVAVMAIVKRVERRACDLLVWRITTVNGDVESNPDVESQC